MKISQELLDELEALGKHSPVKPNHIMEYLPSLKAMRKIVPPIMSTDYLEWVLNRHAYQNLDEFPKTRIRCMMYINHFIRVRTDPEFLSTEAALAHKSTGCNLGGDRVAHVRDMTYAAESLKKNPKTTTTADLLEWHERVEGTFYTIAYDKQPIVTWCRKRNRWYITHEEGRELLYPRNSKLFTTKSAALEYARERFLTEYQSILSEEYHGNTLRI